MFGYIGKLLFVNLSDLNYEIRSLDEQTAHDFLGGLGLGAKILYDEMPAKTPVFDSNSVIGFIRGPMNGSTAFFGGRFTVVSKSPVYGGWNDANGGGFFGSSLTKSGFDGIFIKGVAEKPVYILVDNGKVYIRDASHLWGKTTMDTENALRVELNDKKLQMALIGPAGERMSYMAAVMNDSHRAAARGGTGAVMGSKKLKAVVVRGNHNIKIADRDALISYNKKIAKNAKEKKPDTIATMGTYGTGIATVSSILSGDAGVKNWAGSSFDDFPENLASLLDPKKMDVGRKVKKYSCSTCPLGCGAIYDVSSEGLPQMKNVGRPEYETVAGFGSNMLINNVDDLIYCNHLCDEYGFDTISISGTIAWAMELYNEGLLTKSDLDGIDLTWGNSEAVIRLLEYICKNEGNSARLLSNGSQYAADMIGKGHESLFVASGMELAQHDPRLTSGLGRTYQYDPTPGRHVKGGRGLRLKNATPEVRYATRGTGFDDAIATSKTEIIAASGFCLFYRYLMSPDWVQPMIEAVTGFKYTASEWYMLGLRIFMIRLAFNLREGISRRDYTVSRRVLGEPKIKSGSLAGINIDIETIAENFFDVIGCDMNYVPKKNMIRIIGGLDQVIADLYK